MNDRINNYVCFPILYAIGSNFGTNFAINVR